MAELMLPRSLAALLPDAERQATREGRRPLPLRGGPWPEVVAELRRRAPRLADHVLTSSGEMAGGFVLVVNDCVLPGGANPDTVGPDDALALVAVIAGGSAAPYLQGWPRDRGDGITTTAGGSICRLRTRPPQPGTRTRSSTSSTSAPSTTPTRTASATSRG